MLSRLVTEFRNGIDNALIDGRFAVDCFWNNFPTACCWEASVLLGHYLLISGIKTWRVCGHRGKRFDVDYQSHMWLITEDNIIIDLTGDQFQNRQDYLFNSTPAYVSPRNNFYDLFYVDDSETKENEFLQSISVLDHQRLLTLYEIINQYI